MFTAASCSSNSYFISYLGLDTNASLKSQTVNATAASMMGVEEGSSWHDYIMDNTVKQMTMVQRGLKQAQEEGYQFPASVQEQYEDSLNSLKTSAESTGMSVKAYLQRNLGAIMTEKVYNQQVLRMLQYQAYAQSYSDSLTYTDAELEAAYQADPKAYDKAVLWEHVRRQRRRRFHHGRRRQRPFEATDEDDRPRPRPPPRPPQTACILAAGRQR